MNNPVAHSDAIVILSGGLEYRPLAAARLYTNGCAKTILITQSDLPSTAQMNFTVPESVTTCEILLKQGVPSSAIQMIGTNVTSTRDEAFALRDWLRGNQGKSVIIPTDIFHTRRVRWIFEKTTSELAVHIVAVDPPRYTRTNWWRHEEGLIAFQNEVVKSVYYHLKY